MNVAGGGGLNGFAGFGVTGFGVTGFGVTGFGGLSLTPFNLLSGLTFDSPGTASLSLSHSPSLGVAVRLANHSWKVFMPYVRFGPPLLARA
ncbi:MAG: hypothetical protein JNK76_17720 [Planctomycetales bacterium]|nr:hypothetical protein [Planctomycetales bacterium]